MKRIVHAVFLFVSALALAFSVYFLVQSRTGAAAAARPVATRQVQPESEAQSSPEGIPSAGGGAPINRIPALPNEVILDVTIFNADQEENEEQVLTVRKTDAPDGRLSIVVAKYVAAKKAWVRVWEGDTLSTKLTTLSIQAKDLLGDHAMELVCTGTKSRPNWKAARYCSWPGRPRWVTRCTMSSRPRKP